MALLILGLTHLVVICPTFVHADPPAGNADATSCSDLLLERALAQGSRNIRPQDLSIYQSDIMPIYLLADQLPDFGRELRKALQKRWRFGFDGIENCPTEHSQFIDSTHKVACQTENEVIINPNWYEKLNRRSCKALSNSGAIKALKEKQRDTFVHELLLGITLGTNISTVSSDTVFAALTRQPLPSASELQMILETSGFGVYGFQSNCARSAGNQETVAPIQNAAQTMSVVAASALVQRTCTTDGNYCVGQQVVEENFGAEGTITGISADGQKVTFRMSGGYSFPDTDPYTLYVRCAPYRVHDALGTILIVAAKNPGTGKVAIIDELTNMFRTHYDPATLTVVGQ